MKFPGRHTRPCVQVWLPLSSSVPVGRGSCRGTPSPRGEGRAHQYQAPFRRPGDAVWSLSPAHSCSLPPRDLTARLCLTLSVASCGPAGAPCPGPALHPPDYARVPVPLTTRHLRRVPGSACALAPCTVHGFTRTQVPTRHCDVHRRPHVPCAQGIGSGARAPPESQAALLLCAATCREPRRPQVPRSLSRPALPEPWAARCQAPGGDQSCPLSPE